MSWALKHFIIVCILRDILHLVAELLDLLRTFLLLTVLVTVDWDYVGEVCWRVVRSSRERIVGQKLVKENCRELRKEGIGNVDRERSVS